MNTSNHGSDRMDHPQQKVFLLSVNFSHIDISVDITLAQVEIMEFVNSD